MLHLTDVPLACSRRSDSGARAKTKASERARFSLALSLALFFARAPLSERLEQANVPCAQSLVRNDIYWKKLIARLTMT